jgi:hypothetical protein
MMHDNIEVTICHAIFTIWYSNDPRAKTIGGRLFEWFVSLRAEANIFRAEWIPKASGLGASSFCGPSRQFQRAAT